MYQFIVANIFLIYALIAIPLKKRSTVEPQSIDNKDDKPAPPKKLVEHNGEGMNGFLKAGMLGKYICMYTDNNMVDKVGH